jgi:hypothetical protein
MILSGDELYIIMSIWYEINLIKIIFNLFFCCSTALMKFELLTLSNNSKYDNTII